MSENVKKHPKLKKALIIIACVLAGLVLLYFVMGWLPRPSNYKGENVMMKQGDMPLFIAHGGGHYEFPDNSFEACMNAYRVDENVMFELDVSITSDGVVILSHDTTLDRKTSLTGPIAEHSYADELLAQRVNFGYMNDVTDGDVTHEDDSGKFTRAADAPLVPFKDINGKEVKPSDVLTPEEIEKYGRDPDVFLATPLEYIFKYFPNNRVNVEIKQSGETGIKCLREIIRLLNEYDAYGRTVLASFHTEIYEKYRSMQEDGDYPDNFMYSPEASSVTKFVILRLLNLDLFYRDGICVFQLPMAQSGITLATKGFVDCAHRHNTAVHYWTIDNEEDMRFLIGIGADGIMSNLPHLLKEVYDSYGK